MRENKFPTIEQTKISLDFSFENCIKSISATGIVGKKIFTDTVVFGQL